MPLIFYFAPNSTASCTAAILAELEHAQPSDSAPLAERKELSLKDGDTKTPEFLSEVNPNGMVPAIVHDGVSIWESAAITMYLGETFGVAKELYPSPGPRRGEAMKWIVWANAQLVPTGIKLRSVLMGKPVGADKEEVMQELGKKLSILDNALEGKEFLLGAQYCLADTHVCLFIEWLGRLQVDLEPYKNVKGWMAKVAGRPALKKAF